MYVMLALVIKCIAYYVTRAEEFEKPYPERPSYLRRQEFLDMQQPRKQIYQCLNILNMMMSS